MPFPKMTEDELDEALAARGSSLPRPPAGETDIGFLFEEAGEELLATYLAEASTPAEDDGDAPKTTDDEDPSDGPSSDPGDRGEEGRE